MNPGENDMPEFIYFLKATRLEMLTDGGTSQENEVVDAHFAYLQHLTDRGIMVLVGRTQNNDARTLGIAIFRAESEAAARRIMENDPAVIHGVMQAELFPFRIALRGI
jgi:uncharacterized protein